MARILYVGDNVRLAQANADALHAAGHDVDIELNQLRARGRLDGPPVDVVIVDAARPDGGYGLLLQQARGAWPQALILALTTRSDPLQTAVGRMGLWDPDATLVHPTSPDTVSAKVRDMLHAAGRPG